MRPQEVSLGRPGTYQQSSLLLIWWWDFGGNVYVNYNKHVRLTRNVQSQMGWFWSRLPFTAANLIIEVKFNVRGWRGLHAMTKRQEVREEQVSEKEGARGEDSRTGNRITFD
ncbi:hypothetical protein V8E52_008670 [Russula decolorans]